eukprot:TRINITY_DN5263_c0_g1_i2.p1 TRINITY_DN5263_c0_g1~~TRINITY_DN5263_c0_g1_i2.p1  ORF type:complete len:153 (+),score=17.68 TRINITY_DN5263_c0_g1_i2:64-522(+)
MCIRDSLTGGYIKAGFHEVVYTEETRRACEKAKAEGRSTWRVSSTLFCHVRYDVTLEPIGRFSTYSSHKEYPPINAYDQVLDELKHISLVKQEGTHSKYNSTEIFEILSSSSKFVVFCSQNYYLKSALYLSCLLYTSPSPRDGLLSRMPSSA